MLFRSGELCHWSALVCAPLFFLWNPWWGDLIVVGYALAANLPCILVQRYKERLYATVYHMTSNREDANDLVQDTFIKGYKSLRSFQGKSSFYTWVYRIAVNRTINFLKRGRNRTHHSLDDVDSGIQTDPEFVELMAVDTPRREAGLHELQQQLNAALQKLSENHRAVVVMHDVQGMTHADIARVMGCSEGTVRSRLFYARQQLQGLLSEYL
mgnify:CR=1 FL=1